MTGGKWGKGVGWGRLLHLNCFKNKSICIKWPKRKQQSDQQQTKKKQQTKNSGGGFRAWKSCMRLIWAIDIILFTIFFSRDPTLSCQKLLISWLPYHIYLMYLSSRPLPFCASARQLLFQKLPTAHRDYSTSARFWCTPRCIEAGRKQKTRCLDLLKSHDFSTCSFALRNNPSCALQFWSIGCVSRE